MAKKTEKTKPVSSGSKPAAAAKKAAAPKAAAAKTAKLPKAKAAATPAVLKAVEPYSRFTEFDIALFKFSPKSAVDGLTRYEIAVGVDS